MYYIVNKYINTIMYLYKLKTIYNNYERLLSKRFFKYFKKR